MGSPAQGAGFLVYEHGATAMGMAGAFVAIANNPTAIFHNPAGLAWLEGTRISFGTTLIRPKNSLSLPHWPDPTYQDVKGESQWFYPSNFYISHKINDRLAAGFGFFTPYGLGTKWPKGYPLKYISYSDDMKTYIFNPTLSYKVNENLSVGGGVSYIYSTVSFKLIQLESIDIGPMVGIPLPVYALLDIPVVMEGSGHGWGVNAGVLYRGENFSLGFNWRSGFKIGFEGDLDLGDPQVKILPPYDLLIPAGPVAAQMAQFIPDKGSASTTFNFPHILGVGAAFDLTENLLVSADIHYILWSTFDEYVVNVDVPMAIPGFEFADKSVEEDWKNSFIFRSGIQYLVNETLALRAGIFYDQTPQPVETMDPILPDADRWGFTGGIGYQSGNFFIDVAYQFEPFKDRTSPNREIPIYLVNGVNMGEGTYSTTAHLFGISLGFKL